jgi:hypothetical protein
MDVEESGGLERLNHRRAKASARDQHRELPPGADREHSPGQCNSPHCDALKQTRNPYSYTPKYGKALFQIKDKAIIA